jgi:hypothetical protein
MTLAAGSRLGPYEIVAPLAYSTISASSPASSKTRAGGAPGQTVTGWEGSRRRGYLVVM